MHDGAGGSLWAGQSPHLVCLTPPEPRATGSSAPPPTGEALTYFLGLAGGYYAEDIGGAEVRPIRDAVILEWVGRAQGLRAVFAVDQFGDAHPALHGAARAQLPDGSIVFFGGGNPLESSGRVSRLVPHPALLRPRPDEDEVWRLLREAAGGSGGAAQWAAVRQPDGSLGLLAPELERLPLVWSAVQTGVEAPSPRHGLHACVRPGAGEVLVFGGRGDAESPGCHSDLWALSLDADGHRGTWRLVTPATHGPAGPGAKVWYGATATDSGNWLLYGGSQWQFEDSASLASERGVVWVLDLHRLAWSSIAPAAGMMRPEVLVACTLVQVGGSVLVLGGCMPHRRGPRPPGQTAFDDCANWYAPLGAPWRLDLAAQRWWQDTADGSAVPEPADTLLRSHAAAVVVPGADAQVLLFGGSRYFTGAYFHDLLELTWAPGGHEAAAEAEPEVPLDPAAPLAAMGEGLLERLRRRLGLAAPAPPGAPPAAGLGRRLRGGEAQVGWRGRDGRLRAMVRDGLLPPEAGALGVGGEPYLLWPPQQDPVGI